VKLLAAALGMVLIVLAPLAHGSPIDPSSPGFWDADDFDDVIVFLTSHLHLLDTDGAPAISTSARAVQDVVEHSVGAVLQGSHEPGGPRAPPAV
jgi:hypothetical protein